MANGIEWNEGSTYRGIVRLVSGGIAALVLFSGGDAETAQQTAGQVTEHVDTLVNSANAAYAMIVVVVGEAVKGIIGIFKKEAGETS